MENSQKKIIIVGLPNTGKSQVFNNLTGDYNIVANYPLSTLETKKNICKIKDQEYEVMDTPGLNSLYVHSEEDMMVRNILFDEAPDVIIQCIDANQLKQSLSLTVELLELGIPMVVSLNSIDETAKKGMWIDSNKLSNLLGVPVIESITVSNIGTAELKESIRSARVGKTISYGDIIDNTISNIESTLPDSIINKREVAILKIMDAPFIDEFLTKNLSNEESQEVSSHIQDLKQQYKKNLLYAINGKRFQWVDQIIEQSVQMQKVKPTQLSILIARLSCNIITGPIILSGIILLTYFLVVNVANELAGLMDEYLWAPIQGSIEKVFPSGFWNEFLIGDYGVLSLGVSNAIITVLPILSVFFILYNILEDSGYIPSLSVLTRRLFQRLGLSGSAIMPIVLGFGCKTMATLMTKSLQSVKERYIAIFLIAFAIPCAAQMGLNMSILGKMGITAFLIAFGVLTGVELMAGIFLNKIMKDDTQAAFIQELPNMRLPMIRAVLKKTYVRLYWFLKEAFPIFVYSALALFALDKLGILSAMKGIVAPFVEGFLGLPVNMVDALILTMARHEAAAAFILNMIEQGQLTYIQCIVSVVLTTMFVPCFANIGAMIKEQGAKKALTMALAINISAFILAGALNWSLLLVL